jgi:uncharacterized protein with PIN domain
MPESNKKVVDSWALVAWIRKEPPAPLVRQFIIEAEAGRIELVMSLINVAETFYLLAQRNSPSVAEAFLARLPSLPIRVVSPNEDDIIHYGSGADQGRACRGLRRRVRHHAGAIGRREGDHWRRGNPALPASPAGVGRKHATQ